MSKEKFTAHLGAGAEYSGSLKFEGTVHIDGKFEGDIISDGKLILFKNADVNGNIKVRELVVSGSLTGEITVERCTLLDRTARVCGVLTTGTLAVEEGAVLEGSINMISKDAHKKLSAQASPLEASLDFSQPESPVKQ